MPTTPFIGISVIVHVAIIIFHKIFHIKEQEAKVERFSKVQRLFSYSIVGGMLSLMLFTAGTLLFVSITERHSTVYLAQDTALWLANQTNGEEMLAAAEAAYGSQASIISLIALGILLLCLVIPRIKFNRNRFSVSQGGYSLVQVSLLVGGLLSFFAGLSYIILYLLITAAM